MKLELIRAPHWSRFDYYWRRVADNSTNTPGRAANRLRFTEAAMAARGMSMEDLPLPPAAISVAMSKVEKPRIDSAIAPMSKKIILEIKKEKEAKASLIVP